MRIKIKSDHWIAKRLGVAAITLYPYIFFNYPYEEMDQSVINHEFIHIRQIRDLMNKWARPLRFMGWLHFYVSYLFEYGVLLVKYKSSGLAYINISYEKEAFENQYGEMDKKIEWEIS